MRRDGIEFRTAIHSDVEDTRRSGLYPNGISLGRVLGLQGDQAITNVSTESARGEGGPG
jgi:hypothetical protein